MLGTLRKFLAPPVFEDEGLNFNARNLNVVLLSVFIGIAITILRYIALGKFWLGNAGVIFLVTGVVIVGAYILFQKRYFLASSMIAIVVLTLMPFALILMSGNGIHDTAIMILPVVVVITSMLLPWQGLVGYVVFIALAFGVLVRMEVNLNLVTPFSSLTTNSDFTDALTILIVAGLMSGLLVTSLRRNLRRLSDALKEHKISEERYRAVVENQTEFIVRWKPDGTRTFVNDAYCRFFGLAPEQAVSTSFFPLLMDEDRVAADARIAHLMSGDIGAESYIQRVNKPDGSLSWQEWTDQIVRGEAGQVLEFQSVGRDITDRKQAEDQLRESEDRYRRVIEAAGAVPYYQDFRFDKYEFMGQAIQKLTGYLPEELTASLWDSIVQGSELIGDLTGLSWEDAIARIRTGEHDVWKCDYQVLTKSGQIKWIADTAIDLSGNDGRSYASIGIMQDITERKNTEETLRKQAEQMSALYDIGLTITSNLDLDQILYDLYEKCRQLLPIDTFYIAVYDETTQLIRHPLFYDGNQKGFIQVDDRNIEIAPGVSGHIILTKTTLYLPNFNDPVVQEKYKIVRVGSMLLAGSYVGVPILVHDVVIGVISMQKMEQAAYSSEQIRLLETIATQAAIAIENARLYQAEQERRQEAETLRNSLTNVVTLFELEDIVESILDQIKLVIPYDTASVWRVDGEWLTLIVGRDLPSELSANWKMHLDNENSSRPLIQGEKPFLLNNNIQESRTDFKGPHSYVNSWLAVPLKKRGKIIGQIALDGKNKGQFTAHHAELALTFADQVAIALENASLYSETQQELTERKRADETLRQRDAILQAVAHAAQVMLQSSNWRESINQILDELGGATGASHVYIFENHVLVNDQKVTSLKYEWTAPDSKPDFDNLEYQNSPLFEDDKKYWSGVLSKGQTYIGDMDKLPIDEAEHFQSQGIKSILDVPIFVAGEWWGVIGFDDFVNERAWSQAEIEALEIAGKMMGAAIEREQIDESLRTSEERYRRAISANDSVPYTLDYQKDEYTFMGEMIDRITGYPVNEITPDKMRVLIQETIMRGDLDGYSRSKATELIRTGELHPRSWRADLRIITKDRDERWLSDSSIQILDKNGKPIGSIGILQDITDRKLVEVNLRKRESLLNAITFSAEQFLKTPNWREKIDIVLARLGREFSASHAYVFEKHVRADGVILNSLRYEWVAPGQNSDMDNPAYQNAPMHEREHARYYEILDSGAPFVGSTSFFLESESEKAWMSSTSIKALLGMRIVVNSIQWGTIGFDDMVSEREWNPMEVDVIKIAANVLAAAIEREQADNIIRQSEEKYRNELEGQVIERTSQLTAANKLLQTEKTRIEQVVDEVATLRRLSDFLQSSMTVEEASGIVASHMSSLFTNTSGGLYLINDGYTDLALMSSWGEFKTETVIQPNDCWGMRRGRSFVRHTSDASPACAHFGGEIPDESLCLPLMGQNEIIGMLCLQVSKNEKIYFTSDVQNLAIACADSVALALANLRLRERLRTQTIRDPLTGIFNRRYLEETLEREVHRAGRNQEPLCVVMFEIDDFKQYNNTFGHDAGDYVLKKVSDTMQSNLRKSDFPCRYGGDEFTFLLPNTTLENGAHRAEGLRKAVEALALSFNNQALGQVTVRMGVAAYPKHGETGEAVLKVADDASYRARAIGKNCVVVAE